MKHAVWLLAAMITLAGAASARAQPGPTPGMGQLPPRQRGTIDTGTGAPKVCAIEMKPTIKVVHGSMCKDYCRPHCSLSDWFRSCCGARCSDCAACGDVHTYKVLMKKVVPGPDVPVCRVKELPVICQDPIQQPAPIDTPKKP